MAAPRFRNKEARALVARVQAAGGTATLTKSNTIRVRGPRGAVTVSQETGRGHAGKSSRQDAIHRINNQTGLILT